MKIKHFKSENHTSRFVPGQGPSPCLIMFVGEAPGKEENKTGKPFVGESGIYLNHMLERFAKLSRKDIYVTNAFKYNPPKNRTPRDREILEEREKLYKEIEEVNPEIIVTLGKTALRSVFSLNMKKSIRHYREQELKYFERIIVPTYHPSAILRSSRFLKPFREDLKKIGRLVKERIHGEHRTNTRRSKVLQTKSRKRTHTLRK